MDISLSHEATGQRTSRSKDDHANMVDYIREYIYTTTIHLHTWTCFINGQEFCELHALTDICDLTAEDGLLMRIPSQKPSEPTLSPVLRARLLFPPVSESDQSFISHCAVAGPSQQRRPIRDQGCRSSRVLKRIIWTVQGFPRLGNKTIGQDCPLCLSPALHTY